MIGRACIELVRFAAGELTWEGAGAEIQRQQQRRFRTRLFAADLVHPFLLRPRRQRALALADRAGLLPFAPLFALVH